MAPGSSAERGFGPAEREALLALARASIRAGLDGDFSYVNRAFERMSGLRSDEARGGGWQRAVHPEDRERVLACWRWEWAFSAQFPAPTRRRSRRWPRKRRP